jgi:glycosyltransferase involved in cell wall biosynthesis
VESVIKAQVNQFVRAKLPVKVITGRGEASSFPAEVEFVRIEEIDSLHPEIAAATAQLNTGILPANFEALVGQIQERLRPELKDCETVIIHNVLTKHFNLPLTAAICKMIAAGEITHAIAWCHDLSWTSPHSRDNVYPEYPWTLLKTPLKHTTYVAISEKRRQEIASSFGMADTNIPVIHNGVNPKTLFGLSDEGTDLVNRLDLLSADLLILMPVRVTQAKNIELALSLTHELLKQGCLVKTIVTGPPDPHDSQSMEYYANLLVLRKKLDLEENFHFIYDSGQDHQPGYTISQNMVAELYRITDVLFMPSHREGFGMPILEAGLLGKPIISTNVPAIQDLHLQEPLLFEPDVAPEILAAKMLSWLKKKSELQLRAKMRQEFTWQAIFEKEIRPLL